MLVDRAGFEPATSRMPSERSYQAELPAHRMKMSSGYLCFFLYRGGTIEGMVLMGLPAPAERRTQTTALRAEQNRGTTMCGYECEGIPAKETFSMDYVRQVFARVKELVSLCAKFVG